MLTGRATEIKQKEGVKEEGARAKEQDGYLRWNIGVNHKGKHSGRSRRRRRRRGTFPEGCSKFTRKFNVILELRMVWIFTRLTPLKRSVIHVMKVCSSFSSLPPSLPSFCLLFLPICFFFLFFSLIDNWRESKWRNNVSTTKAKIYLVLQVLLIFAYNNGDVDEKIISYRFIEDSWTCG